MSATFDFDLAGVVGVRAIGAGARERAALERQLGPAGPALTREPDLVLHFVEKIEHGSALRMIGLDDAAFSQDSFLLLRGKHKSRTCVKIPLEDVGGRCELVCERGLSAVPMLVPILNATVLARGHLPLHAAAFELGGKGVIATGWSKGGKTETLLACMAEGARYVADEWLYLAPDGTRMCGLVEPIRVWSWHLDSLPELRARLSAGERTKLSLLGLLAGGMRAATDGGRRHGSLATRTLNRASALVAGQLCVDLAPARLFPGATAASGPVRPEILLHVVSHDRPEIELVPVDAHEVAERMRFSLAEEDQRLRSLYHRFRYAFPARVNAHFEAASERQRVLLHATLGSLRAFELRHPYPVALPALHAATLEALR